jgi:hypothetical protein
MIGGFDMTDPLIEAVEEARRELRWAAGGMTEEEKEDQRRIAEVKEMKLFMNSFGLLREHALCYPKAIWSEDRAAIEFKIKGQVFRLYPSGDDLRLQTFDGKPLTEIRKTDPYFASRVIVAVGDVLGL